MSNWAIEENGLRTSAAHTTEQFHITCCANADYVALLLLHRSLSWMRSPLCCTLSEEIESSQQPLHTAVCVSVCWCKIWAEALAVYRHRQDIYAQSTEISRRREGRRKKHNKRPTNTVKAIYRIECGLFFSGRRASSSSRIARGEEEKKRRGGEGELTEQKRWCYEESKNSIQFLFWFHKK